MLPLVSSQTDDRISFVTGWAAGESLVSRLMPFWIEARSPHFSWDHLQSSIEANIHLVLHLSFVAAVWLATRRKVGSGVLPVLVCFLTAMCFQPAVMSYLRLVLHWPAWYLLGIKAGIALAAAVISYRLYSLVMRRITAPQVVSPKTKTKKR